MKMFKKIVVLPAAMIAVLAVPSVFAQDAAPAQPRPRQSVMDANQDGICDFTGRQIGSGAQNRQGRQANGGQRRGPGDGAGYGAQSGRRMRLRDGSGQGKGNCLGTGGAGNRRGGRQ